MLDISRLTAGLEQREPGIWFTSGTTVVSYPAHGNVACLAVEDSSFWFRHRSRCIAALVTRFRTEGFFLDVGGGNGFVARTLVAQGIPCVLIEPGVEGARAARARGIDPVICATLADAAIADASCGSAGMFDVLEHIGNELAALSEVHRVLRPGGAFFLSVPAYQFLFSADDAAAGHFRRYSAARLARVLTAAGFKITFQTYMFAPLPPIVFAARTVPSRLGLHRGADVARNEAEHTKKGFSAYLMDRLLDAEYRWIAAGHSVPFGGSCLCVAHKV